MIQALNTFIYNISNRAKKTYHNLPSSYDIGIRLSRMGLYSGLFYKACDTAATGFLGQQVIVPMGLVLIAQKLYGRIFKEGRGLYHEYSHKQLLNDPSKDEVALIIRAKRDWSGDTTCLTRSSMDLLNRLSERYSLVMERAGSPEEINQAIDSVLKSGKKVSLLTVAAHHAPEVIALGSFLGEDPVEVLSKIDFNKLDEEASCLFLSCGFGEAPPYAPSSAEIAQYFAGPKRAVFATKALAGPRAIKITNLTPFQAKFSNPLPFSKENPTVQPNYANSKEKVSNYLKNRVYSEGLFKLCRIMEKISNCISLYKMFRKSM